MVLSANSPINSYVGTSGTATYAFTFPVFLNTHIIVTVVSPTPAFVVTTLVLGTDYTVSGLSPSGDPASTGNIVLVNSGQAWLTGGNLTTGWKIVIQINVPLSQTTSIRNQGDFYRSALENALDYLDMQIQQLQLEIGSQLILPNGILPSAFSPILPSNLLSGAGLALVVNSTGTGLVLAASATGITIPVPVSQGGTNSSAALVGNRIMVSSGGAIVEAAAIAAAKILISSSTGIPIAANVNADMGANKITGLANGTAATDAAAFGQIGGIAGVNAAGYVIGTVVASASATSATTAASSGTTYAATNLSVAITPKATTHKIRVSVVGSLQSPNPSTSDIQASIFRGATDLFPGSGTKQGFASIGNGGVSTQLCVPASGVVLDSPATVSATTYSVKVRANGGSNGSWGDEGLQYILVEEIAA